MANNFFSRFPTIEYNMGDDNSLLTLTNIVKNVDVNDVYANSNTFYTYHEIMDGERPDTVSYRLYGTPNYHWTFFILNDSLRAGLNSAWPMSYQQLEHMFVREFDPYTAITFSPATETITGIGTIGLANLIHVWEAYTPYLRLTDAVTNEWAQLLKYDNYLLQLVVYNVEKANGSGPATTVDTFTYSSYFKLAWDNPFDENSGDPAEVDRWTACQELKTEFVNKTIELYKEFDTYADFDYMLSNGNVTGGQLKDDYNQNYVFAKQYTPAHATEYRWTSYRNAASEYYETIDGVNYSVSAYDIVLNENIVEPKFITFFEKEELINSRKEKIRVIRSDKMSEFVNAYFDTLNAR